MTKPRSDAEIIADAIRHALVTPNEMDSNWEAAGPTDGLYAIARAIHHVATAIERLGVNDAATSMGALELVAKEIRDAANGHDEK